MTILVFLDIDGVFTSTRQHIASNKDELWSKFDPVAIEFMNSLHDQYDLKFVLISTWKNGLDANDPMISHWILSAFRNAGFRGEFPEAYRTDPNNLRKFRNRAYEIVDYLKNYAPWAKDCIIFDDNDYDFDNVLGRKRFIKTDSNNGLLYKHMLNAKSLLGSINARNSEK